MNFTPTDQQLEQNRSRAEDEIDLLQVLEALNRRWPWIAGGSILGLIFSGFQLIASKPVYQGEFQIVLNKENASSGVASLLSKTLHWPP